jgi:hypothetical protein
MQRLVGNKAVTGVIQRSLLVTGSPGDVSSMLRLLMKPSGLVLGWDAKTHAVTITGRNGKPASPELARKLMEVIQDKSRVARINLGRKQAGVGFGEFPTDESNPVQELRIDHFEALNKGIPGAGTATLIHEITENFAATDPKVHENAWSQAHQTVHPQAEAEANLVLSELQAASGAKHSGQRLTQYTFSSGQGQQNTITWVEARENEYFLWDTGPGGRIQNARTAPLVPLGSMTVEMSRLWNGVPSTAAPVIAQIAALLKAHPSASVVLQGFTRRGPATNLDDWYWSIQKEVAAIVGDSLLSTDQRYAFRPPMPGDNRVDITINRPGP